MRNNILCDS